jgi:RNA polymerase sigma factor (sigma-70 family)
MLKLSKPQSSHEELFMQRYERLRAWALRLVVGDQQQADDLLHDAFIHFTLHRSLIENVQNLDAYLYTMLRNLHLSQARRLARTPQGHLSLLDYDSADIGLQSVDPRDQIKVQDELRMIGRYACIRKQTSKAGSVLILRFFHGYYPAEIARILNCPRSAVDSLLKGARGEAKLFLQNPEGLTFIRDIEVQDLPTFNFGRVAPDILAELRQTIFSSGFCSGRERCVPLEILQATYSEDATELVDVATLNHLVSCQKCLDEANRLLDLPLLAMRQASETIGRDNRPKGGGGGPSGTGSTGAAFLKRSRRRTKHVFEHRPKELHISVNGFVLGTQTISSRRSELTLNVNLGEKIAFVEVFSERDVRLFFLNVEVPPEGAVDQLSSIELSEGRELDLALNFSDTWPRLHAVYVDPTLEVEGTEVSSLRSQVSSSQEARGSSPTVREGSGDEVQRPTPNVQRLRDKGTSLWKELRSRIPKVRHWTWDLGLFSRPAVVTLLLAAILVGSLFILRMGTPVQPITAANLLQQASANERAVLAKANQVIHQTVTLDERKSPGGELVAQRRIEVWQSADRGISTRRLYDEKNALIAGDWRRGDGVQTLYHHGSSPRIQLTEKFGRINFDDAWRLLPSANEFISLIEGTNQARVDELGNIYRITYDVAGEPGPEVSTATDSDRVLEGNLIRASLVLTRADLHPIEQSLIIRQGNETREFKFIETTFEQKPSSSVAPTLFEPEPELMSERMKDEGGRMKNEDDALHPSSLIPHPSVVATAALEVEVLRLLNQAGADMGEQITITRTREGSLKVDGVVDSPQRKSEILRSLAPVTDHPAVRVQIVTVQEALKKRQASASSNPIAVEGTSSSASSIPADADLRRYFSGRGLSGAQLENGISGFANQALNHSLRIMNHAWALKRLAARFSAEDLRTLDAEARANWLALIKQHATALAQQNESLRRELVPIFSVGGVGDEGQGIAIKSDDDLVRTVERLFEVCSGNDRVIRQAFAITPDGSRDSTIKTPQFWRSLRNAEKLAAALARQ